MSGGGGGKEGGGTDGSGAAPGSVVRVLVRGVHVPGGREAAGFAAAPLPDLAAVGSTMEGALLVFLEMEADGEACAIDAVELARHATLSTPRARGHRSPGGRERGKRPARWRARADPEGWGGPLLDAAIRAHGGDLPPFLRAAVQEETRAPAARLPADPPPAGHGAERPPRET